MAKEHQEEQEKMKTMSDADIEKNFGGPLTGPEILAVLQVFELGYTTSLEDDALAFIMQPMLFQRMRKIRIKFLLHLKELVAELEKKEQEKKEEQSE